MGRICNNDQWILFRRFFLNILSVLVAFGPIFVNLLQRHIFFLCSRFISAIAFESLHIFFKWYLSELITWVLRKELIHMVYTTKVFLEVAIERYAQWILKPRSINSVQTLYPTELSAHELNQQSQPTLYNHFNFIASFSIHVSFQSLPLSDSTFSLSKILHS